MRRTRRDISVIKGKDKGGRTESAALVNQNKNFFALRQGLIGNVFKAVPFACLYLVNSISNPQLNVMPLLLYSENDLPLP
jgi:hypothetical protein